MKKVFTENAAASRMNGTPLGGSNFATAAGWPLPVAGGIWPAPDFGSVKACNGAQRNRFSAP